MKLKRILIVVMLAGLLPLMTGCWTLAAAGAGAYGGYKMNEKGYTIQNPITKEKKPEK